MCKNFSFQREANHSKNKKHSRANPQRNLTKMLHVLGQQTGMKDELYQNNVKSHGFYLVPAQCSKRLISIKVHNHSIICDCVCEKTNI